MAPDTGTNRNLPRYVATAGTTAALGGALVYLGLRDPHTPEFGFPPCPFHLLTGWYCPGCGGLRMMHDLLTGNLGAAVVDNVFALVGLPLLALWLFGRWRTGRKPLPKAAVVTVIVAIVAWTVVRNVPGFPLVPTFIGG